MKRKCCWLVLQCCSKVLLLGRSDLDNFFLHKQNQWSPVEALIVSLLVFLHIVAGPHYLRRRIRRITWGHGCLQCRWRNWLHLHYAEGAQHFMHISRSGDDMCRL